MSRFVGKGGRFIRGRGRLAGPRCVRVGDTSARARRGIVIATGSSPAVPPIPGLSGVEYWTTHDAIQADTLPESLVVLGGGWVGCELGQVFSRFGVDVTIVEASDRLLPQEEPEASRVVESVFAAEGIRVRTGERVAAVEHSDSGVALRLESGDAVVARRLLVAAGRKVDLSELGLEQVGLECNSRYIAVDDRIRAADGVWAMGDVTGAAMFTHLAFHSGRDHRRRHPRNASPRLPVGRRSARDLHRSGGRRGGPRRGDGPGAGDPNGRGPEERPFHRSADGCTAPETRASSSW